MIMEHESAEPAETVLVLRTCDKDLKSREGFIWPSSGPVSAPDWDPKPICGFGLHGLLWGCGNGSLLSWEADAKWLVVEVAAAEVVELDGGEKIKFPRGVVLFAGDRKAATEMIAARRAGAIVGGTSTSGYGGTSTSGYGGTSTSGYGGTSTSGDRGILNIRWYDGKRYRIATMYVGEDGIEPNVPYKLDGSGKPLKASAK